MAFKLDPARPPKTELVRVLRDQLTEAIDVAGDERRPLNERIHNARTNCKKARALLKLMRSRNQPRYRHENHAIRNAARQLSRLRDAAVMVETFDATLLHYAIPRPSFRVVRVALLAHRRAVTLSRAKVEPLLGAFARRLRKVVKRSEGWEPDVDFSSMIANFGRTYRSARRALRSVQCKPTGHAFHGWRKATKAHLYHCRILHGAWPAAMKVLVAEVRHLANLLGDEHDLTVLRGSVRHLVQRKKLLREEEARTSILALLSSRRDELRTEAVVLGERIYADKPGAIVKRVARWWKTTRAHPSPALDP